MRNHMLRMCAVVALTAIMALGIGLAPQAQDGTYTVCSDLPWPPFEMTTESGEFFGFDMDVMRAIAAVKGFDIEIQNLAFDSIIPAVRAGRCDVGASGFTITADREEVVDFSDPYYLSNQAVVIRSDGSANMVTALTGDGPAGAVGAQRGTTGAAWVQDNLIDQGVDVELRLYETYPLAIQDLVNERIDAVIQDEPASQSSVASFPDQLTVAGIINTFEYFGFNVQDGDPNGLLPQINSALGELGLNVVEAAAGTQLNIQSGTPWADLTSAYFGPDNETITAAWNECKEVILNASSMEDVASYAACMADATQ